MEPPTSGSVRFWMALCMRDLSVSGWLVVIPLAMLAPAGTATAEPMRAAVGSPVAGTGSQRVVTQRTVTRRAVTQRAALEPAPQGFGLFNFWRWQQPLTSGTSAAPGPGATSSVNSSCLPAAIRTALADVQSRFGPVTVVSAHRPGARMGGGHMSHHANCQAADFRPAPGTYAAVAGHLRQNWHGGLGTYSSGHIHIDTGPNYQWHGGGGRKRARR